MANYRNQKLLDLAKETPCCSYCRERNHGQVVACHFNAIKFGAGTGIKSHDIPAYLCDKCHDIVDGRMVADHFTKVERELMLYEGIYRTFLWLLESGNLAIVDGHKAISDENYRSMW